MKRLFTLTLLFFITFYSYCQNVLPATSIDELSLPEGCIRMTFVEIRPDIYDKSGLVPSRSPLNNTSTPKFTEAIIEHIINDGDDVPGQNILRYFALPSFDEEYYVGINADYEHEGEVKYYLVSRAAKSQIWKAANRDLPIEIREMIKPIEKNSANSLRFVIDCAIPTASIVRHNVMDGTKYYFSDTLSGLRTVNCHSPRPGTLAYQLVEIFDEIFDYLNEETSECIEFESTFTERVMFLGEKFYEFIPDK